MQLVSKQRLRQTRAEINWAHPLSRLMKDCFLFDGAHVALNHAAPGHDATVTGAVNSSVTADGPAANLPGDVNVATNYMSSPHYRNMASGDATYRLRFVPISQDGVAANIHTLIGKSDLTTLELVIAISGIGAINLVSIGNGGGSLVTPRGNFTVGSVHDLVVTRTVSSGDVSSYQDGAFLATEAALSSLTTGGTQPLKFAVDTSGQGFASAPCHYIAFQAWDRVLSASEIRWLWAEPQSFIRRRPFVYRTPAAAGAASYLQYNMPMLGF